MLTNTRAVLWKFLSDFKRGVYASGIVLNLFYVIAMAYATVSGTGLLYVNIPLLAVAVAYFIFYIIAYRRQGGKAVKKRVARINRYIKIAAHTLTLGVAVYALYTATEKPEFLSVLFAALSAVSWIFQISCAFIIHFFEVRIEELAYAFDEDTEKYRKPFSAVSSVVDRIRGEEPREPKPDTPERVKRRVEKIKNKFLAKKKEEKEARKAKKAEHSDRETANK
jgi:hypothetical protein